MPPLNAGTRSDYLDRMAAEVFDVLVIGGGITGLGVALDASARGYSVALVEKGDFGGSTSSKSTKLVHGGIRYLPQFDFALVREALVERGTLLRNAPFLVQPLAFVLPLYEDAKKPLGVPLTPPGGVGLGLMITAGLFLYDTLAGGRGFARHRRISVEQALTLAPTLRGEGLKEAFVYYDGQTNDTRLVVAALRTATRFGAAISNYAEVTGFEKRDGKLTAAHVRDSIGERAITVRARHIVNAAGIFAERVATLTGDESKVSLEPSKGVHLVVARDRIGIGDTGVVLPETDDGRILFVLPWEDRALIGTTDTGSGDLDHPEATPEDIDYLILHVNRYLNVNLTRDDLIGVYAGFRPLVRSREKPSANLSRTHVVLQETNGMVTIVGGKLTTYRRMAQDTVDVLAQRDAMPLTHPTEKLPLSGAINWKQARRELARRCAELRLDAKIETSLAFNYGSHALEILDLVTAQPELGKRLIADLPFICAEVIYACRDEMAMRLDDALARRMRIELEDRDRGAGVVEQVAGLMAGELGWSPATVSAEIEQYTRAVRRSLVDEGL
ncbi:MAG TPA: glycerol-3-phosphate dehydrogenase/oxidase, partial [Ktedonobacterales bacterium]